MRRAFITAVAALSLVACNGEAETKAKPKSLCDDFTTATLSEPEWVSSWEDRDGKYAKTEIWDEHYQHLTSQAICVPALRPVIAKVVSDGKITWAEYREISAESDRIYQLKSDAEHRAMVARLKRVAAQ
jgi:hypothetical protein